MGMCFYQVFKDISLNTLDDLKKNNKTIIMILIVLYCINILSLIIFLFLNESVFDDAIFRYYWIILLVEVILLLIFSEKFNPKLGSLFMAGMFFMLNFAIVFKVYGYSIVVKTLKSNQIVLAHLTGQYIHTRRGYYEYHHKYEYWGGMEDIQVNDSIYLNSSSYDTILLSLYDSKIAQFRVSDSEKRKFKYPVEYRKGLEYGNDSYDYCCIEPYTSLQNFGLRKVVANKQGVLFYKNINSNIDSAWYQCSKELQTKQYQTLVDTADAFYFHGEIIPMKQLFSEVPQAKEYYDKYNNNL